MAVRAGCGLAATIADSCACTRSAVRTWSCSCRTRTKAPGICPRPSARSWERWCWGRTEALGSGTPARVGFLGRIEITVVQAREARGEPVSYTHLTLPTSDLV